jgi:hypothetical protein
MAIEKSQLGIMKFDRHFIYLLKIGDIAAAQTLLLEKYPHLKKKIAIASLCISVGINSAKISGLCYNEIS